MAALTVLFDPVLQKTVCLVTDPSTVLFYFHESLRVPTMYSEPSQRFRVKLPAYFMCPVNSVLKFNTNI